MNDFQARKTACQAALIYKLDQYDPIFELDSIDQVS
jgi:hypothetical protein